MASCFSFTALGNQCFRFYFMSAGMKSALVELHDGTTMHCWVPKKTSNKPSLILIHGFGANAMWQWSSQIWPFRRHFNLNMVTNRREERIELINHLIAGRKASDLPVIHQETLIIWGEQDQIFPVELGNRLKRHLGDRAELVVFKDAGHGVHLEKSAKFNNQLKKFLLG